MGGALFVSRNLVDQFVGRTLRRIVRRTGSDRRVVLEGRSQFGVDLRVFRIRFWAFHDGADGAGGIAAGAFRALLGIDDHESLALVVSRVNAIHWANIDALSVNLTQALFGNDIRHDLPPLIFTLSLLGEQKDLLFSFKAWLV